MTIKEYREFEKQIKKQIESLESDLKKASTKVNFDIPFDIIKEELDKKYPNKIPGVKLSVMIGPHIINLFKDDIKNAIKYEIEENYEKKANCFISCLDINNRTLFAFSVPFDMDTKLSDGSNFVEALKLADKCTGAKYLTMDGKDIGKILVNMNPYSGLNNNNEIDEKGFIDNLVRRVEANQHAVDYVKQLKEGKRKADMLIETTAKLPNGMRPEKEKPIM